MLRLNPVWLLLTALVLAVVLVFLWASRKHNPQPQGIVGQLRPVPVQPPATGEPPAETPQETGEAPPEAAPDDRHPTLGEKYRSAAACMDAGDYAEARRLLGEILDTVQELRLELSPAVRSEIRRRFEECEKKLAEPARATGPPESPAPPDALKRLQDAVARFAEAEKLMQQHEHDAALRLLLEVREDVKDLPMAEADRTQLERRIEMCRKALAPPEQ